MEKRMVPVAKKTLWRDFMGKGKWKPILLMAGAVLGIALLLYGGSGEKKKEKEALKPETKDMVVGKMTADDYKAVFESENE